MQIYISFNHCIILYFLYHYQYNFVGEPIIELTNFTLVSIFISFHLPVFSFLVHLTRHFLTFSFFNLWKFQFLFNCYIQCWNFFGTTFCWCIVSEFRFQMLLLMSWKGELTSWWNSTVLLIMVAIMLYKRTYIWVLSWPTLNE